MLNIIGLRKTFGSLTAVDNVSFRVEAGQLVGLLGPNGAGKTTTVSMIAGLLTPDAGEVLIGGWRDTAYDAEVGYDERPTDAIQSHLDAQLKRMGAEAPVTHRWAGTMGFTDSGLPLVGPVVGMPNVYTRAGFNGHGMGFAFISAKQLIDSM